MTVMTIWKPGFTHNNLPTTEGTFFGTPCICWEFGGKAPMDILQQGPVYMRPEQSQTGIISFRSEYNL